MEWDSKIFNYLKYEVGQLTPAWEGSGGVSDYVYMLEGKTCDPGRSRTEEVSWVPSRGLGFRDCYVHLCWTGVAELLSGINPVTDNC